MFDAAARNGNFTLAGNELHVTQVAVSKRISGWEAQPGYDLFHRQGRQINPTNKGERLAARVHAALHYLETELAELSPGGSVGHVLISAAASISQLWLPHKLHHLTSAIPDLKLVLNTKDRIRDLEESPDDLSILYLSTNAHPARTLTLLFSEELVPVATPRYLSSKGIAAHDLPLGPTVLATLDCLDYRRANAHWFTLAMWFQRHLPVRQLPATKLTYSSYAMTIDAALNDRGLSLGSRNMLHSGFAEGELVEPSDRVLGTGNAYYLGLANSRPVSEAALNIYSELAKTAGDESASAQEYLR